MLQWIKENELIDKGRRTSTKKNLEKKSKLSSFQQALWPYEYWFLSVQGSPECNIEFLSLCVCVCQTPKQRADRNSALVDDTKPWWRRFVTWPFGYKHLPTQHCKIYSPDGKSTHVWHLADNQKINRKKKKSLVAAITVCPQWLGDLWIRFHFHSLGDVQSLFPPHSVCLRCYWVRHPSTSKPLSQFKVSGRWSWSQFAVVASLSRRGWHTLTVTYSHSHLQAT